MREKETSLRLTCAVFTKNHPVGLKIREKTLLLDSNIEMVGPTLALHPQGLELGIALRDG